MNAEQPVKRAILLAAGRGTRLGALTADIPKPMVAVHGAPVLEHILIGLRRVGLIDFLLVVGYRAEAIQNHFGDGSRWDARIAYAFQAHPNGTGAALALGRDFARGEPILSSYGDILTDYSHYRALLDEYADAPCAAVLGINPVDDPSAGGAVYREGKRVLKVVEKPPPGTAVGCWNTAGINVFGPVIWPVLERLKPSPRGEYELTDAVAALLDAGEEVRACEMPGFWSDVGTPEALANAERNWRTKRIAQERKPDR